MRCSSPGETACTDDHRFDHPFSALDGSYYGATVTSWKVGGKERLFVSSKAALDGSKAVRREARRERGDGATD